MTPKYNLLQIFIICFVLLLSSFTGREWSYYKIDNLSARFPSEPKYLKNGPNHIWMSYLNDSTTVEVSKRPGIINFNPDIQAKTNEFFADLKEGFHSSQSGAKISNESIKKINERSTYYFEFDALSRDGKMKIHATLLYVIIKSDLYKFGVTEFGKQRLDNKLIKDFIYGWKLD